MTTPPDEVAEALRKWKIANAAAKSSETDTSEKWDELQKGAMHILVVHGDTIEAALTAPAPIADSEALKADIGDFHTAFWEAFKSLPAPLRTKFSLETGRNFANEIFKQFRKV